MILAVNEEDCCGNNAVGTSNDCQNQSPKRSSSDDESQTNMGLQGTEEISRKLPTSVPLGNRCTTKADRVGYWQVLLSIPSLRGIPLALPGKFSEFKATPQASSDEKMLEL